MLLALFSVRVIKACQRHGVLWSLENPASSSLWNFQPLESVLDSPDTINFVFDMCRFGQRFKKPTRLATNFRSLVSLARRCKRNHIHEHLHGSKTTKAGAYSACLAKAWAQAAARAAPRDAFGSGVPAAVRFEARLHHAAFGKSGSPRPPRIGRVPTFRPPPGLERVARTEGRPVSAPGSDPSQPADRVAARSA